MMPAAYLKAPDIDFQQRCRKVPFESYRQAMMAMKTLTVQRDVEHGRGKLAAS